MTWEAYLAVAAFLVLFTLWSFLPSRFLKRTESLRVPARPAAAPAPIPPAPAPMGGGTRGTLAAVDLRLVRNPAFVHGADPRAVPRYFYTVRLGGEGQARLPVYWDPRPQSRDPLVREAYRVRVAGTTLEAGNLHVLGEQVRVAVGALLAGGGPPRFWLLNGSSAIPVYCNGSSYVALTDGPRLWGTDLAQLRERYAHYLAACNGGRCGPVTVALLSPEDLDVHRPEAVFVGPGLWVPAFAGDGKLTAVGPKDRSWSAPAEAEGLLDLWGTVAGDLVTQGLLPGLAALWVCDLSGPCRTALRDSSEPTGLVLRFVSFSGTGTGRVTLPVLRLGRWVFATCQEFHCLHVAEDLATLREGLSAHLQQAGVVPGADDVVLEEDRFRSLADSPTATRDLRLGLALSNT